MGNPRGQKIQKKQNNAKVKHSKANRNIHDSNINKALQEISGHDLLMKWNPGSAGRGGEKLLIKI